MRVETFEQILQSRIEKTQAILGNKAEEYAMGGDRLYNFNAAARIDGVTPEKALWGMAKKHLVSVMDLVEGRLKPTKHNIDEKIGDMINYLILLEALFQEKEDRKRMFAE